MNKRSYGEPCLNEDGGDNYDNNLCVTAWCDDKLGVCNYRPDTKDCRNKDHHGKINLVDDGGGYNGDSLAECHGDCDHDELSSLCNCHTRAHQKRFSQNNFAAIARQASSAGTDPVSTWRSRPGARAFLTCSPDQSSRSTITAMTRRT